MMYYQSQSVRRRRGDGLSPGYFPLPLLALPSKPSRGRARQRYGEALCATTLHNHAVRALNVIYSTNCNKDINISAISSSSRSPTTMPASNMSVGSFHSCDVYSEGQQRLLAHLFGVSKRFVRASKLSARTACPIIGRGGSAVSDAGLGVLSNRVDCVPVHSVIMSCLSEELLRPGVGADSKASPTTPAVAVNSPAVARDVFRSGAVGSYLGEDPLLSAIPIVASRVSLPTRLSSIPLTSLLPSDLAVAYAMPNPELLLPDVTPVAVGSCAGNVASGGRTPHFYGERSEYIQLLQRMKRLNMIAFTDQPKAVNDLFGVPKDGVEIRLIIDATPANEMFVACPHVQLPDPSTLARLSVQAAQGTLWMAKADLESFYHQLVLPSWLRPYFSLPGVAASELVEAGLITAADFTAALVYPMCQTLPMGWSHSVFVSQSVHEYVLYHVAKLSPLDNILHVTSPVVDRALHAVYIDDFGVLANCKSLCDEVLQGVMQAYAAAGLSLKLSKLRRSSREPMQLLGMLISGFDYTITLPHDRVRRMARITTDLLRSETVSGKSVQKLVGLWTWQLLLARPALSVLRTVYRYIAIMGDAQGVLWPSVRQELVNLLALLPLFRVSLLSSWHSRLTATDASEMAAGVVDTELTAQLFDVLWPLSASRHTQYAHIDGLVLQRQLRNAAVDGAVIDINFELVQPSVSLMRDTLVRRGIPDLHADRVLRANHYITTITSSSIHWRVLMSSTWRWFSHINQLELQAVVLALRRMLSSPAASGKRLMFLSDSAVVTYSLMKGRTSAGGMASGMRRIAALLLSSGCRLGVVWVPTEMNPADAPSRNRGLTYRSIHNESSP